MEPSDVRKYLGHLKDDGLGSLSWVTKTSTNTYRQGGLPVYPFECSECILNLSHYVYSTIHHKFRSAFYTTLVSPHIRICPNYCIA